MGMRIPDTIAEIITIVDNDDYFNADKMNKQMETTHAAMIESGIRTHMLLKKKHGDLSQQDLIARVISFVLTILEAANIDPEEERLRKLITGS
jgi:hypothetical protein